MEEVARFGADHPFVKQLLADAGLGDVAGAASSASAEFVAAVRAFVAAIDWDETWIVALVAFHVVVLLLVVLTRKWHNFQVGLFFVLVMLAFLGETLNELGRQHWRAFSRTNYFDESGFFMTIMYGVPLVLNCTLALALMMCRTVDMLVVVKRAQLRTQAKDAKTAKNAAESKKTK